MKFTKKDCIRLLWKFGELTDKVIDDTLIQNIYIANPLPTTTLLGFTFARTSYFALFDTDLNDDIKSAKRQIKKIYPNTIPELIAGKSDLGGFFRGKIVYLFRGKITKKRLDLLAAEQFPDFSRSQIVKMIKSDLIKVNGEIIRAAKTEIPLNAKIAISPTKTDEPLPEIRIIFENADVVVIDKPSGILVHPKSTKIPTAEPPSSTTSGVSSVGTTLVDFLEARIDGELLETEWKTTRTGVIHRLDRGTSGVMILAKNPETASFLSRQFADRKVKKTYLAVVHGRPELARAVIDVPIARNLKAPTTFLAHTKGKPARTVYEIISTNDNFSLLKVKPETGRTHQIRVHLAHIGTPIVGDFIYNKTKKQLSERPFLHASSLEITIPEEVVDEFGQTTTKNTRRTFTSNLPADIKEFLEMEGLKNAR